MSRRLNIILIGLGLAVIASAPFSAYAATLYFSPAAQTVTAGQTFTVNVDASSADQAMNAASGEVSFPASQLRVLSISNKLSAMNLWVQNPTFSNGVDGGTIDFAGIILNPGFTGTGANIITVRFQALVPGKAALSFVSGSVLANDGSGTNILTTMGMTTVTVVPAKAITPLTGATTTATSTPTTTPTVAYSAQGASMTELLIWSILMLSLLLLILIILILYILYRLRKLRIPLNRSEKDIKGRGPKS
jgi:hypothetical protein